MALLGGPGLAHVEAELREIERLHGPSVRTVDADATVAAARAAFEHHDLVHVAAHGRFRADNPLFSSLGFADGPLNLYDLERLTSAPATVVLAACEAGAATSAGNELLGTAAAMLRMGVRTVVAASVSVSDEAMARLMVDLHRGLAEGSAPEIALTRAREAAFERGDPATVAAAAATVTYGTRLGPTPR
jgi:CHAT domain-containing protein